MKPPVFSLRQLTVRHDDGRVLAVDGLSLALPRGRALALLGANGAGKSSLIGALLGLYRAAPGSAGEILGAPLGKIPQPLFQKIGFVADGRTPPGHWTLRAYLDYLRPMYPTWDVAFERRLITRFALPEDRAIGKLSRGMKMKAAMIGALAFRPELLVLDEPFGGLDPLTREELIDGLLVLMADGDWSILLSSHDIHEVERLCDSVAILENGKLLVREDLESLQTRFRRVSWSSAGTGAAPAHWFEAVSESGRHTALQPDYASDVETAQALAAAFGAPVSDLLTAPLDLRAILIAHLRRSQAGITL